MVKEFLSREGVQYEEKDVSWDREAAMEMLNRSGQMGVPVTVIDDAVIVGFDRTAIQRALGQQQHGRRPPFGAAIADAAVIAGRQGIPGSRGAYIGSVRPQSPAQRAGLQPNDIVIELDGNAVGTAKDFEQALSQVPAGARFTLTVLRGGKPTALTGALM